MWLICIIGRNKKRVRQNEEIMEYLPNKRTGQKFRKRTKQNGNKQFTIWRVQRNSHKDDCNQEKMDETHWELQKRDQKYKKEPIRTEDYNNWKENTLEGITAY